MSASTISSFDLAVVSIRLALTDGRLMEVDGLVSAAAPTVAITPHPFTAGLWRLTDRASGRALVERSFTSLAAAVEAARGLVAMEAELCAPEPGPTPEPETPATPDPWIGPMPPPLSEVLAWRERQAQPTPIGGLDLDRFAVRRRWDGQMCLHIRAVEDGLIKVWAICGISCFGARAATAEEITSLPTCERCAAIVEHGGAG